MIDAPSRHGPTRRHGELGEGVTPPARRRSHWLLPLFMLLACGAPEPSSRPETSHPAAQDVQAIFRAHLGRTWELARIGEQDIPAPPAEREARDRRRYPGAGSRPTIRFTDDPTTEGDVHPPGLRRAGGWSFCNGYGTAYDLGPGDTLRFHGFQSTLVGCDGPDSLETRFSRGLSETRRIEVDSTRLALIAADGSRLVFRLAADSVDSPGR